MNLRILTVALALTACQSSWSLEDADGDGITLFEGDCNDGDSAINPQAREICNGVDDNCDGIVDGADAEGAREYWIDDDGDGYGVAAGAVTACSAPDGYIEPGQLEDCDDFDRDVNPAADEICNDIDDDCNDLVDDDATDGETWYEDTDRDGFGDPTAPITACEQPDNTTELVDATDCDDEHAYAFPGSRHTEVPGDGIDTDCDGLDICVDLTCDGLPDLVVAEFQDSSGFDQQILIFAGTEDGSFDTAPSLTLDAHSAHDLAVVDFNQDGLQDIVWVSSQREGEDAMTVAMGSLSGGQPGEETYDPILQTFQAFQSEALLIEDFDADGFPDVAAGGYRDGLRYGGVETKVYFGKDHTVEPFGKVIDLTTQGVVALAAADLNEDDAIDLVTCSEQDGGTPDSYETQSTIWWGRKGDPSFFSDGDGKALNVMGCRDVAIADVDGDGDGDLAFAQWRNKDLAMNESVVYMNDGAAFAPEDAYTVPTGAAWSITVAELDGNPGEELIFGFNGSVDNLYIRDWSVAWWDGSDFDGAGFLGTGVRYLSVLNLYGDEDLDVLAPSFGTLSGAFQTTNSTIWNNQSDGTLNLTSNTMETSGALRLTPLDVDEDGDLDVVQTNPGSGGSDSLVIWYNTGGVLSRVWETSTAEVYAAPVLVGRSTVVE